MSRSPFLLMAGIAGTVVFAASDSPFLYLRLYRYEPHRLMDTDFGYVPVDPQKPFPGDPRGLRYVQVIGNLDRFTPERLMQVLKVRNVWGLDFSAQPGFNDPILERLRTLAGLRYLSLADTSVTAAGLVSLDAFPRLEVLDVGGLPLDDASLEKLPRLSLKSLRLGPKITNSGLRFLNRFRSLRRLDLSQTRMTDAGIPALAPLASLETLLVGQAVSSKGILALAELPALARRLRQLDLSSTWVGNELMGALGVFERLQELAITGTHVGDEGLRRLHNLKALKAIELSGTPVSVVGLSELVSLPDLEIVSLSLSDHLTLADLKPLARLPRLRLLVINGRVVRGERLALVIERLRKLQQSPGQPAEQPDSAEWLADLPTQRGRGLHALYPEDHSGSQSPDNYLSAPGA